MIEMYTHGSSHFGAVGKIRICVYFLLFSPINHLKTTQIYPMSLYMKVCINNFKLVPPAKTVTCCLHTDASVLTLSHNMYHNIFVNLTMHGWIFTKMEGILLGRVSVSNDLL